MDLLSRYKNCVCFVFIFSCLVFYNPPYAHATGGGYTSTKHGGNTTDGVTPCASGVNRGLGTDYGGSCTGAPPSAPSYTPGATIPYYYNATEAGQYQAGECAHCHEPHASFGGAGVEPPPNAASSAGDAGPAPYLLMKDYSTTTVGTYTNLCLYCHDNMFAGSGYFGFYQGKTNYTGSSHYNSNNFSWPGGGVGVAGVGGVADGTATWPRRQRSTTPCTPTQGNCGSCLNCHTPHGVSGAFDSGAPATANYLVGTASGLIPRQLIAREEALCLNCHDSMGPGPASTDIKTEVDRYLGLASGTGSGHPVRETTYYNRHSLAGADKLASTTADNEPPPYTAAGGWFTSTSKHAECVDCHNPHTVKGVGSGDIGNYWQTPWAGGVFQWSRTTSVASNDVAGGVWNTNRNTAAGTNAPIRLAAQNRGVWGVNVNTTTGAITGVVSSLQSWNDTTPNFVYELCLKCHSAWAWGSGATPGTAATWNDPSSGKTWTNAYIPPAQLSRDVANDFKTSRVAFHPVFDKGKNDPSAVTYSFWSYCGRRSDITAGSTSNLSHAFVQPWLHTSRITCTDCHEDNNETTPRGPHGSARPFILRGLDTGIKYDICVNDACTTTTTVNYTSGTNSNANIYLNVVGTAAENANVFCLNCHRADVYGFRQAATRPFTVSYPNSPSSSITCETVASTKAVTIKTHKQSRQSHPPDSGYNSYDAVNAAPMGIVCMFCHGAGTSLGGIHGSDKTTDYQVTGQTKSAVGNGVFGSARLISFGGANHEWLEFKKSTVAQAGWCTKAGGLNNCAQTQDGNLNAVANYDY